MSSNITELLAAILSAKYGEEVRGSIHDAIELCYADGKAGVNDLEARRLIEAVAAVNESQEADIEALTARVEELEQGEGGGGSEESTSIDIDTLIFDHGQVNQVQVNNNQQVTRHVTFAKPFTEVPTVALTWGKQTGGASAYARITACILYETLSKTGFDFFISNTSGAVRSPTVTWCAWQPTTKTIDLDITIPDAQGMSEAEVREITGPIAASVDAIKTGYDGTVYTTPGEAVRTQINDLHVLIGDTPGTAIQASAVAYNDSNVGAELTDINGRLQWYPLAVNVTDGSYVVGATGGIGTNANLGYSEFSMLPFRGKGIVIQSYLWQGAGYAFLDADGHYITGESANTKGITPAAGELTKVETSVPYNAYTLRVSLHKSYAEQSDDYYFLITENKASKYIFIGDSYGTGFNRSGSTTGWIDGTAASIGLKTADYDKQAKGGTGFCHPSDNLTFTDLLNASTLDKETVGHIVVCGGYNDKEYSESQLLSAFDTFAAKAREKYPFAEICVGMISHTTKSSDQATIMSTIRLAYMAMCKKDGVRYLSNVEYALLDSDISSADGVHPDQIGADHLILAIGQALKSGSASILNI